MKLDRFINRPVLSTVISVLIVILGIIGLATLPVTQYPDIAPPTVQVRATYTGANSTAVLNSVIAPLEDQINGVENMMYIQSSASNNGAADINVYFNQGTDPDMAAVNVQNRVSMAQGLLPAEVTKVGVTTQKRQNSMLMVFSLYDETDSYNIEFIENYANINLIPEIKRVKGVGDANVLGQDYSMRIWLKPDVMAQYKLVPTDVSAALAEQNIEAAPGQFGERGNQTFQYTIRYKGRLQQTTEFEDIVIKALPDGNVLRLGDVADIELGRLAYTFNNMVNGHKAVSCIVYQMAGSNATETISDLEKVLAKAQESLPTGLNINIAQNANDFLFASIHEVIKTLIEAFILVFIVVYIFLQDLRSTLIPTIAIPVALIGTFFILSLVGFSLNLLTLCALVLAIAIVVDDAIVVVEGVHAKLDQGYTSARLASIDAMNELFFTPQLEALKKLPEGGNMNYCFDYLSAMLAHNFMNPDQFAEFYWPYMKQVLDVLCEKKMHALIFSEGTILRYKDCFKDYPKGFLTILPETDDVFEIRKELPNIAIMGGMPNSLLGRGTKQACLDRAKRVIDELGCDGGFMFCQDKMGSFRNDANPENLKAVCDFVREYA